MQKILKYLLLSDSGTCNTELAVTILPRFRKEITVANVSGFLTAEIFSH